MKRIMPRAKGRADRIFKRSSHITVVVSDRLGDKAMGQKVHPNGIRLGILRPWNATWFANTKDFADNLDGDHQGTSVPYK